jgi:hypothetical protein
MHAGLLRTSILSFSFKCMYISIHMFVFYLNKSYNIIGNGGLSFHVLVYSICVHHVHTIRAVWGRWASTLNSIRVVTWWWLAFLRVDLPRFLFVFVP